MKKTALAVLGAGCVAALLLAKAAAGSHGYDQPNLYSASAWLAAMLAFGICVMMLVEYSMHGRRIHLYLGGAFLSLGMIGVWDAMILPSSISTSGLNSRYIALWNSEWITFAAMLVVGAVMNRGVLVKRQPSQLVAVLVGAVLWASLAIFLVCVFPAIAGALAAIRVVSVITSICAVMFCLGYFVYSRQPFHRNNAVLIWLSYGLIFAALSVIAGVSTSGPSHQLLFGVASLLKVIAYLLPLTGMLAEQFRMHDRMQEHANDLANLIQAQQAVVSIKSIDELFQRIVELTSTSLSAKAVCLMPFDEDRGTLFPAAFFGLDGESVEKQLVFRPGESAPGEAYSNRATTVVRDVSKDLALSRKMDGARGIDSAAFAPLLVKGECLGVLAVFFGDTEKRLQKEQVRLLEAFATQAALAVGSARLHGRIIDTAKVSQDNVKEMDFVWEIGQAVASKLDIQDLVDTLAEKLRTAVDAKNCSVLVFDADETRMKILGHKVLTRHESIEGHVDQCDMTAAMVAKRGEPLTVSNLPNSCQCMYPAMAVDDVGTHHLLSVPMSLRGFMGAITVFRQNAEPFGEREKRLLTRLAPLVATAIRNAELYEREKKIAESLQKSFLPDLKPMLPGFEITSKYKAAFDESIIGGDFYDLIDLGNGKYGITVGDVSGKGLDAAIYTAMSRYMIQAYSSDTGHPAEVITRLNKALHRFTPSTKFVTLVFGVLDTNTSNFTYVNAGHESPFHYKAGEDKSYPLPNTGPAVGAMPEAEFSELTIKIEAGDIVVLYTDGASEVRSDGKFLGTEGVQVMIESKIREGVHDLPDALLAEIQSYADNRLRDDVAILAIKARVPGSLF